MDSGNVNRKVRVDITWKCGSGRLLYQHAREYVREKGLRIPMVLPIRQELGLGLGETVDCIMGCAWDWVRRADELGLP